ncbi:MAG: LPS export ABC transporter periplasmic protein LptC [Acidobacteria bacterium]|nr:LPS export ABC transporter periplasmic protein LptC [Acidobacteriota bacterium]
MSSWQRRARAGFGLFAIVFAGALYFAIGERPPTVAATPPPRLDPKATVETRGGNVVQLKGAQQDVRVEFAGQVTYEDGQSKLLDVKAYIGKDQSSIDVSGDVVLATSDGLTAKAREAHYIQAEGVVKAPGPVQFTRGRMTGTGVGFTYDKQRDTIWLLDRAVVTFAAEGDLQAMEIVSGSAGFARADRYMRFERHVRLTREGQIVEADDATVRLFPDRDEADAIELHGNSTITGSTGVGSLRAMRGRDINLDYGLDGRTLERVALAGQAGIQLSTSTGEAGQQLAAEWIDLTMGPDGAITSLVSRDQVNATLPATGGGPARAVTAASLAATGAPGQGLTGMHFAEGVTFAEAAGQSHAARLARARTLDLVLAPGTGELQDARFQDKFTFEEGNLRASSASAAYQVTKGILTVTGRDGTVSPQVSDARMRVDADTIEVTLAPRRLAAQGSVSSMLKPGPERDTGASLLSATEAAFVTSGRLTYDEESGRGVYTDQARLWQGETSVRAATITVDDKRGDLTAAGEVVSTLPLGHANRPIPTNAKPTSSVGRGATFTYDDATRRASYEKNAQLNGPEGNLSGDRIDIVLAANENAVDRLEANGNVRVIVDKREATGTALTYHPSDARYVLVGAPVRFVEECRENTGKTLTFFRGSDRIVIDGNEETRTQTRGGGKCPEPRIE